MNLNYTIYPSNNLEKLGKYEIKKINNKKYILPCSKSTKKEPIEGYIPQMLVDLLNIGNQSANDFFDEEKIENLIIDFANKYGLLGFIYDLPINQLFFLDEEILLNNNFSENDKTISVLPRENYFEMFFPSCSKTEIKKLIDQSIKIVKSSSNSKEIIENTMPLFIGNNNYAEPLDMFMEYAEFLYYLFFHYDSDKYAPEFHNFKVQHLDISLTNISDEQACSKITMKYLKQLLELHLSTLLSEKVCLLKTCKHCGKAFIAKNPKAEYDTPQCKNQANVYKSRGKKNSSN